MRCFKHTKLEAVGVCSSCGKGVCSKCAVEKDGNVYCKDCISKSKIAEMKCYNHPRSEAVGVCSSCGRPICVDCSIEKERKLYCRLCSSQLPAEFEPRQPAAVVAPQVKYAEARPVARVEEKHIPLSRVELSVKPSETVSSTLVGGIFSGFMMGLPFINMLLLWSALGGALSVYLLKLRVDRYGNGYIGRNDAITTGAISGVFAALIATMFNVIYSVLLHGLEMQANGFLLSIGLGVDIANFIIQLAFTDPMLSAVFILVKFIATIMLFAILGAVGGVVSSELSRK
ncbi:hypothetical protein H0N99_01440 [Candidatus Micrarchaeota archaeon]|nr:hypothetical protein [Candidatus Micrarchaeota archaeon]